MFLEETKPTIEYYMIDKERLDIFRVTLKLFKEFNDQYRDIFDNLEEIMKSSVIFEKN